MSSCENAGAEPALTSRKHRATRNRRCAIESVLSHTAQPLLIPGPGLIQERAAPPAATTRRHKLEKIAIILIVLWLLGMVSGYTMGNFIYVLLIIAIVLFLVRLISGRRV